MSQQEFVPRSQDQQSDGQDAVNDEEEIYQPQYPYHWSGTFKKESGPRDEPPSSYAEPGLPRGYSAQGDATRAGQQKSTPNAAGQQWARNRGWGAGQPWSSNGDAFEQGYRPYSSSNSWQGGQGQWNVPPWARPQPRRRGSMGWVVILLVFVMFMIRPLTLLLAGIGIGIFGIILPIIMIVIMLSILRFILRAAFWPGRYRRFGRGPFWW